jgi:hypothetical protein
MQPATNRRQPNQATYLEQVLQAAGIQQCRVFQLRCCLLLLLRNHGSLTRLLASTSCPCCPAPATHIVNALLKLCLFLKNLQ